LAAATATSRTTCSATFGGVKGSGYGWDWDAGSMYIRNETDQTRYGFFNYENLQAALNGQGGFGYYRIGPERDAEQPGHLRLHRAADLEQRAVREHAVRRQGIARHLQDGRRPDGIGGWATSSVVKSSTTPGTTGHVHRQHRRPRLLGCERVAQHQRVFAELYMPVFKNLEVTAPCATTITRTSAARGTRRSA
jgi:hypothetical protein